MSSVSDTQAAALLIWKHGLRSGRWKTMLSVHMSRSSLQTQASLLNALQSAVLFRSLHINSVQ
jgi:hypothetical protein